MVDVPCESLICSDYSAVMELVRLQSDKSIRSEDIEDSIMVDGYKEIPTHKRLRRSLSAHYFYDTVKDNNKTLIKTFSSLYKRIATLFFVFNRFMLNPDDNAMNNLAVVNSDSGFQPFNIPYDFRIKERIFGTMNKLKRCNRMATDRIVAMIPSMPISFDRFKFGKYKKPSIYDFSDCFTLFIENPNDISNNGLVDSVDVQSTISCEIRNKKSHEIISECGPYECLYEEQINSINDDINLNNVLYGVPIKQGKVKVFHKQNDVKDGYLEKVNLKQCLMMVNEYLSGSSISNSSEKTTPKTYFNIFYNKEGDDGIEYVDDSARERFEEHINMHTIRWDEVQYDDVEIVLRDNNNSIIKLPYNCTIM